MSFLNLIRNKDIIVFIESKLRHSDHMDLSYFGFSVLYRSDRKTGSGGVAIAIRSWLKPFSEIEICDASKDLVIINILNEIFVGGVYIPPRDSPRFNDFDRFQYLDDCLCTISSKSLPYILVGDFNARFGKCIQKFYRPESDTFTEHSIPNRDTTINRSGQEFLNICNSTMSRILTGSVWKADFTCFRYNGQSVVDTGICSEGVFGSLSDGRIHTSSLSDHSPISFRVHVRKSTESPRSNESRSVVSTVHLRRLLASPDRLYSFQSAFLHKPEIVDLTSEARRIFDDNREISKQEISGFISKFYSEVSNSLGELFPKPTSKRRNSVNGTKCPYQVQYSKECVDARRAFSKAQRAYRRNGSDRNYAILYRRRLVKKALERGCKRRAEILFLKRILNQSNSQVLWQQVRLKSHEIYNGPLGVEEYTDFLESIANGKFVFDANLSEQSVRRINVLCLMNGISNEERNKLLYEFPIDVVLSPKMRKAVGLDGWSGELMRCLYPFLANTIP